MLEKTTNERLMDDSEMADFGGLPTLPYERPIPQADGIRAE
jgi:hypothetical protein